MSTRNDETPPTHLPLPRQNTRPRFCDGNGLSFKGPRQRHPRTGRSNHPDMPRSDEAAAFYHAVYLAIQEIPRGRVTTYGHIAALIGTRASQSSSNPHHHLSSRGDPPLCAEANRLSGPTAAGGHLPQASPLGPGGRVQRRDSSVAAGHQF